MVDGEQLLTEELPPRERFEGAYQGKPPWDIGKPQKPFVDAADQVIGSVLDAGCGTGENALYFAERGRTVTGIDFLKVPIREAQRKAQQRGLDATFIVQDALALPELGHPFDSIIDCGLFHVFSDEDRPRYVDALASVTKQGGRLFLMCFSNKEPGTEGPRRVSQQEIRDAFASGWKIESITEARFEIRPDFDEIVFSEGGAFAWFCVIQRSVSERT